MKRAFAALLAAWLLFAAAAAEGTELEIVYFPQGGFCFGYPAALERAELTETDYDAGLMLHAADADGNELTLMRYESRGYTLETLAASLRGEEGVSDVLLDDSSSKAYVAYTTETGMNIVILGEAGYVYEAMLTGGEALLETTAEMIGGTLKRA